MGAIDTYAKRKRVRERGGKPDVYQYDVAAPFLRKQVSIIFHAALGHFYRRNYGDISAPRNGNHVWEAIAERMEREAEGFPGRRDGDAQQRCLEFMASAATDDFLSIVEIGCRILDGWSNRPDRAITELNATQRADDAIEEINTRFREHAFGYQFENGDIIRIDDQVVHAEIVKPALHLLAQPGFEKANENFMTAHRHYRAGETKDAVVAANRAFESALKAICKARGWSYADGDRAAELVTIVRQNGLFPDFLDKGLDTYVSMMKTGLPGVRNNAGGHGEGPEAPRSPEYFAGYAIHLTAANILLAINAHLSRGRG